MVKAYVDAGFDLVLLPQGRFAGEIHDLVFDSCHAVLEIICKPVVVAEDALPVDLDHVFQELVLVVVKHAQRSQILHDLVSAREWATAVWVERAVPACRNALFVLFGELDEFGVRVLVQNHVRVEFNEAWSDLLQNLLEVLKEVVSFVIDAGKPVLDQDLWLLSQFWEMHDHPLLVLRVVPLPFQNEVLQFLAVRFLHYDSHDVDFLVCIHAGFR